MRRHLSTICIALLVAASVSTLDVVQAAGKGEPGPVFPARIELGDEHADLKTLNELGIDIDAVFHDWARVYLIEEELEKLRLLGFAVTVLPDLAKEMATRAARGAVDEYHTYETLTADLQAIALAYPDIVRLISIGPSYQGRELWMVKITDNPDVEEDEPEVGFIAAMHGDEVVGKEMCFNLILHLTERYGQDPRITDLVDDSEIWILPSMNPDGTALGQRYNVQGYDLNRNFPDPYTDPVNTPDGRPTEIQRVMSWAAAHTTNLSANMHGGALVANYPFDSNATGQSTYTAAPNDGVLLSISRTYADNNPTMYQSNSHPSFNYGVCNGADWYMIHGGMQDWNYFYHGNFQLTLELGDVKWPPASTLPGHWADNLQAMLGYFERAQDGMRGIVTDAETGAPLGASVFVLGNEYPTYSDPDVGDYHRLLLPGSYTLQFSAPGYSPLLLEDVVVSPGPARRYDVALEPLDVSPRLASARVLDGPSGNGWLDPGETADLALTLHNMGRKASTVFGQLVPIGWLAEVERAGALYGDIPPGESAESAPPHHRIAVSPDAPPGHKIGFAVRWTAGSASGITQPLYLPLGESQCESSGALDVPQTISNRHTTRSTIQVPTDLELYDLTVTLDITHGYVGDLRVDLVSPSGVPVALHNRSGGSTDDIQGTYGEDLTSFDPLSRLHGVRTGGEWHLDVNDGAPGDTGSLNSWSLELCGRAPEATPPEMRFSRTSVTPNGVSIEWWPYPGLDSYRVYRSADPTSAAGFTDVTAEDDNDTDTRFLDTTDGDIAFYLVTGVGPNGEGPTGHFGD